MKEKQKYEKIKEYVDHGGNKNRVNINLFTLFHYPNNISLLNIF